MFKASSPLAELALFVGPLMAIFTFNCACYARVWCTPTCEKRLARLVSLFALAFSAAWGPSVTRAVGSLAFGKPVGHVVLTLEALCAPLHGALNACVYGSSLPSIWDYFRSITLGLDDNVDALDRSSEYSPGGSGSDDTLGQCLRAHAYGSPLATAASALINGQSAIQPLTLAPTTAPVQPGANDGGRPGKPGGAHEGLGAFGVGQGGDEATPPATAHTGVV